MKKTLIILIFLIPSICWGKVGDIYYCEMKILTRIIDHKEEKHKNEKFTITRYEDKIILQSDWFFDDYDLSITQSYGDEEETFMGQSYNDVFFYNKGLFLWTSVTTEEIISVSATCSN